MKLMLTGAVLPASLSPRTTATTFSSLFTEAPEVDVGALLLVAPWYVGVRT
jgi:hypothetical protein